MKYNTHTQVSLEERQLLKLSGSNSIPEVEEAQKEIVQNELKVCTKLKSSKIQPKLILYIGENYILKIIRILQQYIFSCLSCICISKESYQIHQFFEGPLMNFTLISILIFSEDLFGYNACLW